MDFVDSFPDADLVDMLGDTITYVKSGAEYEIKALMEIGVSATGTEFTTIELDGTVEILLSSINFVPKTGDKIIHKDIKYKLDARLPSDNSAYQFWALVKV